MSRRAGWDRLKPSTRTRYDKFGGRSYYESGGSLKEARGHAGTPERPSQAARNPEKFAGYFGRQTKEIRVITTDGVKMLKLGRADRSKVGSHWNEAGAYTEGRPTVRSMFNAKDAGDIFGSNRGSGLEVFRGMKVTHYTSSGRAKIYTLEADPSAIDRVALQGQMNPDSIYRKAA
jgi:hypothetical protein